MSVAKECVVKEWVKKTKQVLKEEERKQAIVSKFIEIFGMEPQIVWDHGGCVAKTRIGPLDEYIKGRRIWEMVFEVREIMENESDDMNWGFEEKEEEKGDLVLYRWTRNFKNYHAEVILKVIK